MRNCLMLACLFFGLALTTELQAASQATVFQGSVEARQNCQQLNQRLSSARQSRIEELVPQPANDYFTTGTCLDALMNTRINIFTIPSLGDIFNRITEAVRNRACQFVMQKWNKVVGKVNETIGTNVNVPYLGTVFDASVGQGSGIGGPISINNGQGIPNVGETIKGTGTQIYNQGSEVADNVKATADQAQVFYETLKKSNSNSANTNGNANKNNGVAGKVFQ